MGVGEKVKKKKDDLSESFIFIKEMILNFFLLFS